MLFPATEMIAETPKGRIINLIVKYLHWFMMVAVMIVNQVPDEYKLKLVKYFYDEKKTANCFLEGVVSFLNPFSAKNFLLTAYHGLLSIKELDTDLINENHDKLSYYFGSSDYWFPKEYVNNMQMAFPSLDTRVCVNGIKHCFVMKDKDSLRMAEVLAGWFRKHMYL